MSVFSTVVCPRCAPGIGGGAQRKFGGTLKKFPELQNRVGAYVPNIHVTRACDLRRHADCAARPPPPVNHWPAPVTRRRVAVFSNWV